ncbi:MAG: hypothetical protein FRX48_01857 [Lasallia pustulata]|uniref:Uncharacterized protein n=1 Tax=Lasallia pustulata TaxID=136370 RepID=A0A5M8Q171_9LECA|nr:MAG: hypothetical protein FRX48_01857 [Lasallia pustulata]
MEDEPGHLSHSRVGAEGAEGASEWVVAPESASTGVCREETYPRRTLYVVEGSHKLAGIHGKPRQLLTSPGPPI